MPVSASRGRLRGRARDTARAGLLAGLFCAAPAQAGPIGWAVYDAAPFMITAGADRDAGIFDRIRALLDRHLAGAPQPTLAAPFPRILALLQDGAEFCFVGGAQTPERDGFALFSLPVAILYPLRLVVHGPRRAGFAAPGPLSLAALLADPSLRTSTLQGRSLGEPLDGLLKRTPHARVHSDIGEGFRMLLADRLDYLLEFSAVAAYAQTRYRRDGGLVALPFVEAPAPVPVRVMCPRTEWGGRQIARIDAVLRVERPTPAYREIVEAWSDAADRPTIRATFDTILSKSP